MASSMMRGLAEAAAKAGGKGDKADSGDVDLHSNEADENGETASDADIEAAMTDMAGEYRKAIESKDDKALGHVLMAMIECCASAPPPPDLEGL